AGLYPSPVAHADVSTSTTHKTLRGPRGGLILTKKPLAAGVDRTNFPGNQGGPLMHVIAAKAVCFQEALKPEFKNYQQRVLANARTLANELTRLGFRIVSGGTDCHLLSADLRPKNITGKEAETCLYKAGITVNKNTIPYDPEKPAIASGIRLGTPAVTTRGMGEPEMQTIASWINEAILAEHQDAKLKTIKNEVLRLCQKFPVYPDRLEAMEALAPIMR
ncbi:MAG: serine hydroxymethyltransferase, partial [Elusimicrobia bacterium]|nr:serine hydroxymethyltransferase [Elusimicrobiota bacterium]